MATLSKPAPNHGVEDGVRVQRNDLRAHMLEAFVPGHLRPTEVCDGPTQGWRTELIVPWWAVVVATYVYNAQLFQAEGCDPKPVFDRVVEHRELRKAVCAAWALGADPFTVLDMIEGWDDAAVR